jgi:predicted transposase YdaD
MRRDTIFYQLFRQSPTLLFELLSEPPDRKFGSIFQILAKLAICWFGWMRIALKVIEN